MGKISTYFSYLPKKYLALAVGLFMAVALTATAVAGFGPDRPTKEYHQGVRGFDYVTFNSFTNVPDIGDERQFYVGKYAGENTFHPTLTQLREGDEVSMRVYIHNNADSSLNESGEGIARDVNVKVDIPGGTAQNTVSKAEISASNANPTTVWSTVDFAAENGGFFNLDFVEGSATITDKDGTRPVGDSLVTTGVNIGDVRGCFEYAAAIDFKIKVNAPNYEIQKQVAVPGEAWQEEVQRNVGEETSWLITFENKGSTNLDNVTIVDDVPPYNTVVPGSVQLFDTNFPDGFTFDDSAVQADGTQLNVNIGTYAPGGVAYIKFKTTIDNDIPDLECNRYRFQNVAYATPEGYSPVNDGAFVVVEGNCNPEQPFVKCTALGLELLNAETRTVKATANVEQRDVTITGYQFNWGDGNEVTSETNMAEHSYDKAGKYTVVATINYEVNGSQGETGSRTCEAELDFDNPPTPVTPSNPSNPVGPSGPSVLPVTGPAEIFAGLFGTGTLAGATHAWVNSRRALKKNLVG